MTEGERVDFPRSVFGEKSNLPFTTPGICDIIGDSIRS